MIPTLAEIDAQDPTFVEDLQQSQEAVHRAADWLRQEGFEVRAKPLRIRPDIEQMRDYGDDGDLEVVQRVEVKRRNIAFTCREDFPYPTVIVDVCHTYDRASPKPSSYIIYNRDMTAWCVVHINMTWRRWTRARIQDRAKGREREFYFCPKELVFFYSASAANPAADGGTA